MTFSLSILLYIFYAFLLVWLFLALAALYHMLKFGFKGVTTLLTTAIFIVVSIAMLSTSFFYINQINWETEIDLFVGSTEKGILFE